MREARDSFFVGLDVGSTTAKAVALDRGGDLLWKRYRRHNTRQTRTVRDLMAEVLGDLGSFPSRVFLTGSGARALCPHVNGTYIQEVNAVTYAVERLRPGTGSVVELGGQDAKVIVWKSDGRGRRSTTASMNDKCAGGTGATLDKILAKIGITHEEAARVRVAGKTIHRVAAKCGVFAETDVVGLLKGGVDSGEVVASLCAAIVEQNLEVLVRGDILRSPVLLLGGPHTYLPALAETWRERIVRDWRAKGWDPGPRPIADLVLVPEDAQYFAAIGAVFYGMESEDLGGGIRRGEDAVFPGLAPLDRFLAEPRAERLAASGAAQDGLVSSAEEVEAFERRYGIPPFEPPGIEAGGEIECHLGIDGGSTSSKLVLLDASGEPIYRDYALSRGNPIDDCREMFGRMERWAKERDVSLRVAGAAATGYAASILRTAFDLDLEVVETVAHTRAAVEAHGDVDVVCDVGGQDIKVLFLKHGRVVDFKLNTQCSAGNGYFLQGMAEQLGIPIEEYAARAFRARRAPVFNYGCAVFMEQDRVDFQQLGWTEDEIMAGLAKVLPHNIWSYVVQEPNISRRGARFVLQGGTQRNLAAVKAQVDHILESAPGADVRVHRHAELCGAIGAALEARDRCAGAASSFVGPARAARIRHRSRSDESTRCRFCSNRCRRTFVDISSEGGREVRFVSGHGCDRGAASDVGEMRSREREREAAREARPNLVHEASVAVFEEWGFEPVPASARPAARVLEARSRMRVGIPRLLNLYYYAPFFSTYLRALGVGEVVYSDYTSERLWKRANTWGSIDPCFPAKVAPAHVWDLLEDKAATHVLFPIVTHLESPLEGTMGENACVIQMGTPEVVHAAFTKDRDHFAERGVEYWRPLVRMDRPREAEGRLFDYFAGRLDLGWEEHRWAVGQGRAAMDAYLRRLRREGRRALNRLIEEDDIGVLVIGHPYHHDPGLNHGIPEEFRMRGFSVLCIESLPVDGEFLGPLFGTRDPGRALAVGDVWPRNFNRNTSLKLWAAKVASRHPNLAVIDLSSFKCGHDAPTYSNVDRILDASETPHFLFHDIDQNRPSASLRIRVQTIDYFLREERERLRMRIVA